MLLRLFPVIFSWLIIHFWSFLASYGSFWTFRLPFRSLSNGLWSIFGLFSTDFGSFFILLGPYLSDFGTFQVHFLCHLVKTWFCNDCWTCGSLWVLLLLHIPRFPVIFSKLRWPSSMFFRLRMDLCFSFWSKLSTFFYFRVELDTVTKVSNFISWSG